MSLAVTQQDSQNDHTTDTSQCRNVNKSSTRAIIGFLTVWKRPEIF